MAIILEGPDNSGKSTLAKVLSELTGWPIEHSGGPGKESDFQARLLRDIDLMQQKVIMDRSFIISDSIYSPACRGQSLFDPRPWYRKIQALDTHDADFMLIFCTGATPMTSHIVKPHETQAHVDAVLRNQQSIINRYQQVAEAFMLFTNAIQVNPRRDTERVIELVNQWSNT